MKKVFGLFLLLALVVSCGQEQAAPKVKVYAWTGGPGDATDKDLLEKFQGWKDKGIAGLMFNGGHDPATYERVGKIAKDVGMEFHTWIPTMVQPNNPKLKKEWYAINGKGESAKDKPAYVPYYQFLCPNREEVQDFLADLYGNVADVEYVDGVHLDYIRFPDVILARGLWDKYDLVMDREYPQFDYCYCDKCVSDFKEKSGIDILEAEDPSTVQEWKQFRYDLITNIANRLADVAHGKGKQISAAVFPGPNSIAKQIVRQEWDKWNLDAVYPMNYNDFYLKGTDWIGEVVEEEVTSVDGKRPIYSGLFIRPEVKKNTNTEDPETHGLTAAELEEAIKQSVQNGAAGICLFTPGRMTDAHWEVFTKAIHTDYSKE